MPRNNLDRYRDDAGLSGQSKFLLTCSDSGVAVQTLSFDQARVYISASGVGHVDIDHVVELRVHGVSGTPPEELLDRPLVTQVAGDLITGFYRPRLAAEANDDVPVGVGNPEIKGPPLEGYVWGGLTSGAPSRSFWLLLLPFTLGNVAPRLRPMGCGPRRVRLIWFVSRLLSLALTLVLVAALVGIGVDLVGWQCGSAVGRCGHATPGWFFDPIMRMGTGRRLMIGALFPLVGLAGLWFLSQRTIAKYENVLTHAAKDADADDEVEPKLGSVWMWNNLRPVRRMRGLHLQVGAAATLAMTGAAAHGAWQWIDGLLAVAILGYAVAALWSTTFTGQGDAEKWHEAGFVIWAAWAVAAAGTAWWLQRCTTLPEKQLACDDGTCHTVGLPHFGETIVWLLFAELALVTVIAALIVRLPRLGKVSIGEPGPKFGLFGMGSAVIALLSVFLASVFTAGAYMYAAAWLRTGSLHPSLHVISDVTRTFAVPEAIADAGFAYAIAVLALIVCLVAYGGRVLVAWLKISTKSWLIVPDSYVKDYPGEATDPKNSARAKAVLHDLFIGRIVDTVAGFLGLVTAVGGVLTAGFAVILGLEHIFGVDSPADWLLDRRSVGGSIKNLHPAFFSRAGLQGKGAYLVVLTLVLLVALGAAAFRAKKTRRSVGILWDLASFWPRMGHPLAPPCYAERTVPELVQRIRFHTKEGRGVVLAGHSQGTVISAATIMQLDGPSSKDDPLEHLCLLTFGCVLRRLYGRYFPAYFGAHTLIDVGNAVDARWWNLWRYTDYLGGPILSGPPPTAQPPWNPNLVLPSSPGPCVDLHLIDPPFHAPPGDPATPPARKHSDFPKVREFQIAASRLAELIPGSAGGDVGGTT